MKIDPRLPEPVQPIIKDYLRLTEQRLVSLLNVSSVIGSIALGDFNEYFSDIDFTTMLSRRASPIDLSHLRNIHQSIEKAYLQWKMSGSYVQASDLGKLEHALRPYPQFHDGVLHPAVRNGINSVPWWELKNHGIPIVRAAAGTLPFTVSRDIFVTMMKVNLNTTGEAGHASQNGLRTCILTGDSVRGTWRLPPMLHIQKTQFRQASV